MSDFRVIQGCPCNPFIAPYIAQVTGDAHAVVNSIYRGEDAKAILHAHGRHTQKECYDRQGQPGFGPANPPGHSSHELRSDGLPVWGIGNGGRLHDWQQGFDVDDANVDACVRAARAHGWVLFRPYPSGSEHHHLNFRYCPKPNSLRMRARIIYLRHRLPTK